nr:MAG TPA: PolyVal ADP-Ribosyltransferase [Caudoviricetes sp.]
MFTAFFVLVLLLSEEEMRVYHGTNASFDSFSKEALGSNTNAPSAALAFFFASKEEISMEYIKRYSKGLDVSEEVKRYPLECLFNKGTEWKAENGYSFQQYDFTASCREVIKGRFFFEEEELKINNAILNSNIEITVTVSERNGKWEAEIYYEESAYASFPHIKALSNVDFPDYDWNSSREINTSAFFSQIDCEREVNRILLRILKGYYSCGKGRILECEITLNNPLIYDFKGKKTRDIPYSVLLEQAKANGNDGAIFLNTYDSGNRNFIMGNIYAVFDESQIQVLSEKEV